MLCLQPNLFIFAIPAVFESLVWSVPTISGVALVYPLALVFAQLDC